MKSIFDNHVVFGPSNVRSMSISYPPGAYVRIAEVVRVSYFSRELDIRFIDGAVDDTSIYRAEVLFGSYAAPVEGTDPLEYVECPTPSASVIGKGDRVNVIVANDIMYVVSKFDTFDYPNNGTVTVYPDKVLLEYIATGLCVGTKFIEDEPSRVSLLHEGNRIDFISSKPNAENNRVPYRLLKEMSCSRSSQLSYTVLDNVWQEIKTCGGGPLPVQPLWFNNSVRQGRSINGLPVISSAPYGKTDYTGSLSMYSSTTEDIYHADSHPLEAPVEHHYYGGETILWFEDEEPEWVLAIAVFPSWDGCKYIKFIEVPVYGWSEVARNNVDAEDFSQLVEYKRYEKFIREIYTLQRSWIDWSVIASNVDFSGSFHKALIIPAIKVGANKYRFVIHDGYGYSNGAVIFRSANRQKLIYGHVERHLREDTLASNGSPYDYTIQHDNHLSATSNVSLWYDVTFRYSTVPHVWESQTTTPDSAKESWKCYTDGANSLFKKLDLQYYADGSYSHVIGSPSQWDGDTSGITHIDNNLRERRYWNSTSNLICEYLFHFDFTDGVYTLNQNIPVFHYANIEIGLFVVELIQMGVKNLLGLNMPLNVAESNHKRKIVAWYKNSEYTLMEIDMPFVEGEVFPIIYNFWPWLLDAGTPLRPTEEPYDVTTERSSIFYLSPFCWYFREPAPKYSLRASSYPTFQGDVSSVLFVSAIDRENTDINLTSDYLKVVVSPKDGSWSVHIKNIFELTGGRSISFPGGGGSFEGLGSNTLIKLEGSTPQYEIAPVTEEIRV